MNPQVMNSSEFRMTDVTPQLLFIKEEIEFFFKVTEILMTLEFRPGVELFLAEMAFVVGALGVYLSFWNMK